MLYQVLYLVLVRTYRYITGTRYYCTYEPVCTWWQVLLSLSKEGILLAKGLIHSVEIFEFGSYSRNSCQTKSGKSNLIPTWNMMIPNQNSYQFPCRYFWPQVEKSTRQASASGESSKSKVHKIQL